MIHPLKDVIQEIAYKYFKDNYKQPFYLILSGDIYYQLRVECEHYNNVDRQGIGVGEFMGLKISVSADCTIKNYVEVAR